MKKALFLALFGWFAAVVPALAHPPAANVNFSSERGMPFGLVLDGRPLTRGGARQVHVNQLMPGLHWADFILPTPYGGAVRFRSRVWLEPGLETSFVLITRPGRPLDLRQVGAVALYDRGDGYGGSHQYQGYGYGYDNRYNNGPAPRSQGGDYGRNYPYNGGSPNGHNEHAQGYNPAPAPNYNNGNGYGSNPTGAADDDDDAGYYPGPAASSSRTLPPQAVDALVQAVQQRPFEAGKLSLAKEALSQHRIQTDDLNRLLQTLNFESSRVELATFAYPHVADRQNFYRVYQYFNFEASKREVEQAVANAPQS